MLRTHKRFWAIAACYYGRWRTRLFLVLASLPVIFCFATEATARRLEVGPERILKVPSAAAALARDGDSIIIDPGEYRDCAVWSANHLTILGMDPGVLITDESCEGKALFVTKGADMTIGNITFAGARVADGNGAGVRAEGRNLTIERSRFFDNQDAILAADSPHSVITITDSTFVGNGKDARPWGHGVYVGHIALLRIDQSRFFETQVGHHVKSRALRTELIDNNIEDGQRGTSSFLVDIPNGGAVLMRGNLLEKGPQSSNSGTAIAIGEEGAFHPTPELLFIGNRFANDQSGTTVFVRNLTATKADLQENMFSGPVKPVSSSRAVR